MQDSKRRKKGYDIKGVIEKGGRAMSEEEVADGMKRQRGGVKVEKGKWRERYNQFSSRQTEVQGE